MLLGATSNIGSRVARRDAGSVDCLRRRKPLRALDAFELACVALLSCAQIELLRALDGLELAFLLQAERSRALTVRSLIPLELQPTAGRAIGPLRRWRVSAAMRRELQRLSARCENRHERKGPAPATRFGGGRPPRAGSPPCARRQWRSRDPA